MIETPTRQGAARAGALGRPAVARNGAGDISANPTQRIADSITAAIVERRLMPGTKLAEQKIADIFKVSRTLVRQALNQLSRDKLVTLEPARGARVAEPSVEEARQVFEARQHARGGDGPAAARAPITPAQIAELRTHLRDEQAAVQRTDVSGRTRLLADFHVVLARHARQRGAGRSMLAELVSRSSLIALMYQSAHSAEHSFAEHVAIVDALEKRRRARGGPPDGRAPAASSSATCASIRAPRPGGARAMTLHAALSVAHLDEPPDQRP